MTETIIMTKSDLITALADKEKLSEKQATEIIKLIFSGFTNTLKKGGRITIRDFGSFTIRDHDAYTGKNPKTGTEVDVKPKKLLFFKVGKGMKALVINGAKK